MSSAQSGKYRLKARVTRSGGGAFDFFSKEAWLLVGSGVGFAPSVTKTLQPYTVAHGGTLHLTVRASGTGPLYYQWLRNDQPIPNATERSFSVRGVNMQNHGGRYAVQISNAYGSILSYPVQLYFMSETPHTKRDPQFVNLPITGDPFVDYVFATPTTLSPLPARKYVDEMTSTSKTTITYSFSSIHSRPWETNFWELNANARRVVRKAIQRWAETSHLEFIEVDERYATTGTIRFYILPYTTACGATTTANEIFFRCPVQYSDDSDNSWELMAVMHELGHSLHNFVDVTPLGRSYDLNNHLNTMMSYNWGSFSIAPRPMLMDVPASQYVYGLNESHRFPGSTIRFEENDNTIFDAVFSADQNLRLDLSNRYDNLSLDLYPGMWSQIGQSDGWVYENKNLSFSTGYGGTPAARNIRTLVKEIIAGTGNDIIQGNEADNRIKGGPGNDTYIFDLSRGPFGNDSIEETDAGGSDKIKILGPSEMPSGSYVADDLLLTFPGYGSIRLVHFRNVSSVESIEIGEESLNLRSLFP